MPETNDKLPASLFNKHYWALTRCQILFEVVRTPGTVRGAPPYPNLQELRRVQRLVDVWLPGEKTFDVFRDLMVPAFRELLRGMSQLQSMAWMGGSERGNAFSSGVNKRSRVRHKWASHHLGPWVFLDHPVHKCIQELKDRLSALNSFQWVESASLWVSLGRK